MTDIPSDHSDEPGPGSRAPVVTEEPRWRRGRHSSGNGTAATTNEGANGATPVAGDDAANGTAQPVRGPAVDEPREAPVTGRVQVNWRHALAAGLACFALWLVLDGPTLLRSAQAAPLGTRRTVAIDVLRPIAAISNTLGLSHVEGAADRAIGHTSTAGSGVLQIEGVQVRHHRAPPLPPPTSALSSTPGSSSVTTPTPITAVTAPDGLAPLAAPTQSAPLRLLVVGDSLGIDFGQPLVNDLAATDVVSAVLDGHIDTGLSRPDYFNWQTELQHDLVQYQPQAVVVFIGANDPQSFVDGSTSLSYGTPAWNAAYAKRVGDFMTAATGAGARVLWIGMPPMADPTLNAKMENLNSIDQGQATAHPGVTYFASWSVLANAQGQYSAFLPDASGNEVEVRDPDGTHITEPGAQRLSQAAITFMGHEWGINL
jgi:hypothetical protein